MRDRVQDRRDKLLIPQECSRSMPILEADTWRHEPAGGPRRQLAQVECPAISLSLASPAARLESFKQLAELRATNLVSILARRSRAVEIN